MSVLLIKVLENNFLLLHSSYVVVLCCYVLIARHTCTIVQLYSVQPLYSHQKVLTDPQSESDRGEDQNIVSEHSVTQNTEHWRHKQYMIS